MNKNTGTESQSFEHYLLRTNARLRRLIQLRATAAILLALFLITLMVAVGGSRFGFTDSLLYISRFLLVASILGLGYVLWLRPLRNLNPKTVGHILEQAVPDLDGRAETYTELLSKQLQTPFLSLLDQDASRTVAGKPVSGIVSWRRLALPALFILTVIGASGWLFSGSPDLWRDGARQLWLSWLPGDEALNSSFQVTPGDAQIRNGEDIRIIAEARDFAPESAELYVRFDNQEWQQLSMAKTDDELFEYMFYGLNQSMDYYVGSALTDSDSFSIEVLTPPRIENIVVTYTYPDWTGLESESDNPGGNMLAVHGTVADIAIQTDRPLEHGELFFNGQTVALTPDGDNYQASIEINARGNWYVTDVIGNEEFKLTEEFEVRLLQDQAPEIQFVRPGRDWSASPIEEVSLAMEAQDDFAIEKISLHYAVNAGEWQSIDFDTDAQAAHIFFLEDLAKNSLTHDSDNAGMTPGDLISYYAEAHDHQQSGQTDIMFINVRPFDRRFSQSQQSGGQSGQGAGREQQEISRRQREILVATWNLLRQNKSDSATEDKIVQDNATLLAEMQETLAEQTKTLVRRSNARQLVTQDPKIAIFVDNLKEAAEAMIPSSKKLMELKLSEAVQPQQKALQFLQRAEAVFKDIQVSQQQATGQGNNSSSQDMAEMFELEMDLAKNQYEVPDTPATQDGSDNLDDIFEKLRELAMRQQQMAEQASSQETVSSIERWQLEKLRRELEELKQQLQNQQQARQNQNSSQQQTSKTAANAAEKIEQALRSMQNNESSDRRNADSTDRNKQAMKEAGKHLQEALDSIGTQQRLALQQEIDNASKRTNELLKQQRQTGERLQQAMEESLKAQEQGSFSSGLTPAEEGELAKQKRQMQRELEEVATDLAKTEKRFLRQSPKTAEEIRIALEELKNSEASAKLGISGDAIDMGIAQRTVELDSSVTEAIREFRDRLSDASALARIEGSEIGKSDETTELAGLQEAVQNLRQALDSVLSNTNGSNASSDQTSDQAGENAPNSSQIANTSESKNTAQGNTGYSGWRPGESWNPESILSGTEQGSELDEALQQLRESISTIEVGDVSDEEIQLLQKMTEKKAAEYNEQNIEILAREFMKLRRQAEQIEIALSEKNITPNQKRVQTPLKNDDPSGFENVVADYFRMLSEGELQ